MNFTHNLTREDLKNNYSDAKLNTIPKRLNKSLVYCCCRIIDKNPELRRASEIDAGPRLTPSMFLLSDTEIRYINDKRRAKYFINFYIDRDNIEKFNLLYFHFLEENKEVKFYE